MRSLHANSPLIFSHRSNSYILRHGPITLLWSTQNNILSYDTFWNDTSTQTALTYCTSFLPPIDSSKHITTITQNLRKQFQDLDIEYKNFQIMSDIYHYLYSLYRRSHNNISQKDALVFRGLMSTMTYLFEKKTIFRRLYCYTLTQLHHASNRTQPSYCPNSYMHKNSMGSHILFIPPIYDHRINNNL